MIRYALTRGALLIAGLLVSSAIIFLTLRVFPGDVAQLIAGTQADPQTVEALRESLGLNKPLLAQYSDWIAGILRGDSLEALDWDSVQEQIEVNALGPLRTVKALLPNLAQGAKLALITSRMGSIADNSSGGYYGYRMSKAALNAAGVSLARDLAPKKIAVAILHPGYVRTDMTGNHGNVTPEEAAKQLLARIDALTVQSSGTFWHANGEVLPW